jgi:hypothetical protein
MVSGNSSGPSDGISKYFSQDRRNSCIAFNNLLQTGLFFSGYEHISWLSFSWISACDLVGF